MKKNFLIIIFSLFLVAACNNNNKDKGENKNDSITTKNESLNVLPEFKIYSFKDFRDNHVYHTMHIGNQIWCVDNIEYNTKYGNCNFHGGRLFTYNAAVEACPDSFSIPSDKDWNILFNFVENELIRKSSKDLLNKIISSSRVTYWFKKEFNKNNSIIYDSLYELDKCIIVSMYLNKIGFTTEGEGYDCMAHDGYTYFWTSTSDKKDYHNIKMLKDLKSNIPYPDFPFWDNIYGGGLIKKNKFGLRKQDYNYRSARLKCIKK